MSDGTSHIDNHFLTRAIQHEFATVPTTAAARRLRAFPSLSLSENSRSGPSLLE
jgi:hypothetical protein